MHALQSDESEAQLARAIALTKVSDAATCDRRRARNTYTLLVRRAAQLRLLVASFQHEGQLADEAIIDCVQDPCGVQLHCIGSDLLPEVDEGDVATNAVRESVDLLKVHRV